MRHSLLESIGVEETSRTSSKFSYLMGFMTLVFIMALTVVLAFYDKLTPVAVDLIKSLLMFVGGMFSVNVGRIAVESVAGKEGSADAKEKGGPVSEGG